MHLNRKQYGFTIFEVIICIVLVGAIGLVGWKVIYSHKASELQSASKTSSQTNVQSTHSSDIKPTQKLNEVSPSPSSTINPVSTKSSSTTSKTSSPQPSVSPQIAPKPTGKVTVSSDGCYVTAWGAPGMTLTIYVQKNSGGGGGDSTYTIPASGTITEASGAGNTYETTTGVLYSNGAQVASNSHSVTSNSCPPAGPSN